MPEHVSSDHVNPKSRRNKAGGEVGELGSTGRT
jgi:hypothetical protein